MLIGYTTSRSYLLNTAVNVVECSTHLLHPQSDAELADDSSVDSEESYYSDLVSEQDTTDEVCPSQGTAILPSCDYFCSI